MDNKCPKCGEKLNFFYLKSVCPKCGCDLVYYNLDARLEADAKKAQAEWDWVDSKLAVFKRIFKKGDKK